MVAAHGRKKAPRWNGRRPSMAAAGFPLGARWATEPAVADPGEGGTGRPGHPPCLKKANTGPEPASGTTTARPL